MRWQDELWGEPFGTSPAGEEAVGSSRGEGDRGRGEVMSMDVSRGTLLDKNEREMNINLVES